MVELKKLKLWVEDIRNIVIDLNISLKNAERLADDKYRFDESIKRHGFFQHHWYQLRFITVIQLCKLLSDGRNEKRSYLCLCNHLETKSYDYDLLNLLKNNSNISNNIIKSEIEILDLVKWIREELYKRKNLINKIKSARNRIYAHKDPNANVLQINLDEIRELVNLASNIYNEINFKLFYTRTHLELLDDWSVDYVLRYMNEVKQMNEEKTKPVNKKT